MGKTALLREFTERAETMHWRVGYIALDRLCMSEGELTNLVTLECRRQEEALSLAARLTGRARGVIAAAGAVLHAVQIGQPDTNLTVSLSPEFLARASDLRRSLASVVDAALAAGYAGWLLVVDDAQWLVDDIDDDELPLSLLAAAIVDLHASGVPLGLVLTGFPVLRGNLARARAQLERHFRGLRVDGLSDTAVSRALTEPLSSISPSVPIEAEVVEHVVREAHGYPHFVQIWGAELWNSAADLNRRRITARMLTATQERVRERIAEDIYGSRMDALGLIDRDLVIAALDEYPPLDLAGGAVRIGLDSEALEASVVRLSSQGLIQDANGRAEYVFTVPGFDAYLASTRPQWLPLRQGGRTTAADPTD